MASEDIPLLAWPTNINVTTQTYHRPSPPEPLGSVNRPSTPQSMPPFSPAFSPDSTPHLTLHDFRKYQHTPLLAVSPDQEFKRVRRKASLSNLSGKSYDEVAVPASSTSFEPWLHFDQSSTLLPPLLTPPPTTPPQRAETASPSLSSTITTLQSSPSHTPVIVDSSRFEPWRSETGASVNEPIRSKRKFANFRPSKRLPKHTVDEGEWQVFAAVYDLGGDYQSLRQEAEVEETEVEGEGQAREAAWIGAEDPPEGKRGRSVRFAGLGPESKRQSGQGQQFSEAKDTTLSSAFSLSNFKFPAPPTHLWEGTFGHLAHPTPPTSPNTLHYKGAPFDLVNPHDSLLLAVPDLETPAELDGLLDDYFHDRTDSSQISYAEINAIMNSSQQSIQTASDSSRRGRTLYTDPEAARRDILRIPESDAHEAVSTDEEPPTAPHSAVSPNFTQAMTDFRNMEAQAAEQTASANGRERPGNGTSAAGTRRGSSVYPHSNFSDPFDLHVSDNENERNFNRIDHIVAAGRDASASDIYQGPGNGDEGDADVQPAASTQDQSATYSSLFDNYDYTRMPQTVDADVEAYALPRPPSSVERARGNPDFGWTSEDADELVEAAHDEDFGSSGYWERMMGPPEAPAPPPPAAFNVGTSRPPLYYTDCTELPTSDQTYGNTGQLLNLTPQNRVYLSENQVYPPYIPLSGSNQGFRPSFVAGSTYRESFVADTVYDDGYEDAKNVSPEAAALNLPSPPRGMPEIPKAWSGCDLPRRNTARNDDRGLTGRPMARSSSHYPTDNESAWESTQASESRVTLGVLPRPSEESYANTSVWDENRLSLAGPPPVPAQGQPHQRRIVTTDGSVEAGPYVNKAHRLLFDGPSDEPQDAKIKTAERILSNKIAEDSLMNNFKLGRNQGSPRTVSKEQRKADLEELEKLRREHPIAVRTATDRVLAKLQAERAQRRFPVRPYNSNNPFNDNGSFERIVRAAQDDAPDHRESRSLRPRPSNLQFSNTIGSFCTTPIGAPPMPGMTIADPWSPINSPPTAMTARARAATFSSERTGNAEEYEMDHLTRSGWSRPAMSSQTGLRSLHLSEAASSTMTSLPGPNRPLTDEELATRAPNWTMQPRSSRITRSSRHGIHIERPIRSENMPMLRTVEESRDPALVQLQKDISRRWASVTWLFPPTALMYGLGYFDKYVARETQGRVTGMRKKDKLWALRVIAPLGLFAYLAVGLIIAVVVLLARAH